MTKRTYETPVLVSAGSFARRTGSGSPKAARDPFGRRWLP
ncbi:keywimysin-related RiPP [Amycolatopsis nigrescens]